MRAPLVMTAFVLAYLSVEAAAAPTAEDTYRTTSDAQKIAWMDRGMDAVRLKLRDPASAEFRGICFSRTMGAPLTCGQVNAKNAWGGYPAHRVEETMLIDFLVRLEPKARGSVAELSRCWMMCFDRCRDQSFPVRPYSDGHCERLCP